MRIFPPGLTRIAMTGGAAGAVAVGVAGELVARGLLPAGLGHWKLAVGPAVFAVAGVGLAAGGFAGATAALLRLPPAPRGATAVQGKVNLLLDGLAAGLLAAVTYWLLGHLLAWMIHGDLLEPSRYLATLLLGYDALVPGALLPDDAVGWGSLGLLAASLPWGFVLAALAWAWPALFADGARAGAVGVVLGVAVWVANVYVAAPLLGMPWFTEHDVVSLFLLHAPTFGVPAALWLHHRVVAA